MRRTVSSVLFVSFAAALILLGGVVAAADESGESNWQRFKEGARQAGGAAWEGTKNVARKTGDFLDEKYDEAKDYIQEKREGSEE